MDLVNELMSRTLMLDKALEQFKMRGNEYVNAEAKYYEVKAKRVLELEAEGKSASLINMTIKGDREVNKAMIDYKSKEVLYKSAQEFINGNKLAIRVIEAQIQREWGKNE